MRKKAHAPGTFPPAMLIQRQVWITPAGDEYEIQEMGLDEVTTALDYLLANAGRVRRHYAIGTGFPVNMDVRPRRWMLRQFVTQALMRRLLTLEEEPEPSPRITYLTAAAEAELEAAIDKAFGLA